MAWTTPIDFVALATLTAAQLNALQTNLKALWKYNANGDMEYYSSPTAKTAIAKGSEGQVLAAGATAPGYYSVSSGVNLIIGNGIEVINTGVQFSPIVFPFDFVITSWQLLAKGADSAGSIVVDLWVDTYANYPATVADTITASAKPTLSTAKSATDSTLTGWDVTIAKGSHMIVNVDSAATLTQVTLSLLGYKVIK